MARVRHIFRWDLDKTYLKTELDTVRDLVRTARATAEERENIPGSAALIHAIRESAPEGERNMVYFISGSPEQLRSVIERKFSLDGFEPDGFTLKPTVSNLLRGRFRALREQVPYKLGALLRGRTLAPVGSRETLIGDDAESDAFVYSLYADLVAGLVSNRALEAILKRTGAYPDQIKLIERELEAIIHEPAVVRILIHLDQLTPPGAFQAFFPRVVPIYNHLETAMVLVLDGTVRPEAIRDVCRELAMKFGWSEKRLVGSAEDILRRQRLHRAPEAVARLAEQIGQVALAIEPGDSAGEVVARIAERVSHLQARPPPRDSSAGEPARDYVRLLDDETERKEEARRQRKLYARTPPRTLAGAEPER